MRPIVPLTLLLALPAHAKRPDAPTAAKVPSIEEVVAAEGFTPTPSQSEIYKPGAVLVPNGRGGHDVVVSSCIDAEPDIAIMSQSSIATTLAGGVSARLGVARGAVSAGVEKRLSFVDPEQRTIALGDLVPNDDCLAKVDRAGKLQDLSQAIVMHDVLVAIIKNTVCTKADASGGVVALGAAEASAYSECVQESDGQVPLGYKAVPLDKVLAVSGSSAASASGVAAIEIGPVTERGEAEVEVGGDVDFAELARRAAQAKAVREAKEAELAAEAERIAAEQQAAIKALAAERARLEEQERVAAAALEAAQRERIAKARETLLTKAAADLAQVRPLLHSELSDETKPVLQAYVDKWGDAKVRVDDLVEEVKIPGVVVVLHHLNRDELSTADEFAAMFELRLAEEELCDQEARRAGATLRMADREALDAALQSKYASSWQRLQETVNQDCVWPAVPGHAVR
ncbi:MAG: hypothetical protein CL927_19175 [Deltaproteobacteria bacterium]|nr:hypothetical protein [Deltaproteobacteria bacterium]HCH65191.1 hypothetical protein [Deltaproteobacteria bacterium]